MSGGRYCQTCKHKSRASIDRALVDGTPAAELARLHGLPERSVQRHAKDHLPEGLTKAAEAKEAARADDLLLRLERAIGRINKLFDACDSWLADPLNPELYDIGPRSGDINVIYEETADGRPVRRKATMAQLLAKLEDGLPEHAIVSWESKHADPRELILKTAGKLQGYLELIGRMTEQLKEREGEATIVKVYIGMDPDDV